MASKLDEDVSSEPKTKDLTDDQTARSVVVTKIPRITRRNALMQNLVRRHFEWSRNGGGKIDCIQFPNEETAIITFESSEGLYIAVPASYVHEIYGGKCMTVLGLCVPHTSLPGSEFNKPYDLLTWLHCAP